MLTTIPALVCTGVALAGLMQSVAGATLLHRALGRPRVVPASLPPVTVLKPLYGDELLLEEALSSFCEQNYDEFQIVFGVQSAADPALQVVDRVRTRFPHVDIDVVIDPTRHGRNGKVSNLINMMQAARHDVLVISDSDIHAAPDTLSSVVAALSRPGVGLATTLYTGWSPGGSLIGSLGTAYINHDFLPGALVARALGRQDCLGAIMALTRETLDSVGGFRSLADHVADDALLGQLVRARGFSVALADTIPATTVQETRLPALVAHELRWRRTIKSVAPVGFALSIVQYPLFWATLALAMDCANLWSYLLFASVWLFRSVIAASLDTMLQVASPVAPWCLPLRDLLSAATMLASYRSNRVAWRGQNHQVTSFSRAALQPGKG